METTCHHIRGEYHHHYPHHFDAWAIGSLFHPALRSKHPALTDEATDDVCFQDKFVLERPEHHLLVRQSA